MTSRDYSIVKYIYIKLKKRNNVHVLSAQYGHMFKLSLKNGQ